MDTVEQIIQEVRELMDEENTDTISDSAIINALNRAQEHVVSIYSKHYAEPYIGYKDYVLSASQTRYPLPKDAFSDRVIDVGIVETTNNGSWYPVTYIRNKQAIKQRHTGKYGYPDYYTIQRRQIEFIPEPSGSQFKVRVYYIQRPEKLTKSQGRITGLHNAENRIQVNSLGSSLETINDNLHNFINVIDSQTGEVKATYEIDELNTTTQSVIFKASPTRTTIAGKSINTSINEVVDEEGNPSIELDDHICLYSGTCIPYFDEPSRNYMIQSAVVQLTTSLGNQGAAEEQQKSQFEKEVKDAWSGRELGLRIDLKGRQWERNRYRFYRR